MKNKKIRQMFAMTLTGVMLCTLPVCAAEPRQKIQKRRKLRKCRARIRKDGNIRKNGRACEADEETKELVRVYRLASRRTKQER